MSRRPQGGKHEPMPRGQEQTAARAMQAVRERERARRAHRTRSGRYRPGRAAGAVREPQTIPRGHEQARAGEAAGRRWRGVTLSQLFLCVSRAAARLPVALSGYQKKAYPAAGQTGVRVPHHARAAEAPGRGGATMPWRSTTRAQRGARCAKHGAHVAEVCCGVSGARKVRGGHGAAHPRQRGRRGRRAQGASGVRRRASVPRTEVGGASPPRPERDCPDNRAGSGAAPGCLGGSPRKARQGSLPFRNIEHLYDISRSCSQKFYISTAAAGKRGGGKPKTGAERHLPSSPLESC